MKSSHEILRAVGHCTCWVCEDAVNKARKVIDAEWQAKLDAVEKDNVLLHRKVSDLETELEKKDKAIAEAREKAVRASAVLACNYLATHDEHSIEELREAILSLLSPPQPFGCECWEWSIAGKDFRRVDLSTNGCPAFYLNRNSANTTFTHCPFCGSPRPDKRGGE